MQHHRNHSVDQQKSVPMSLYASTVHGKVFISDKIQSCTKYLQHTHDSTIGLEPTRTTEDCRTFGAHLEILLYTAATWVSYHAYQNHSIIRLFTSISNFRVFSTYKERRPWNLAVNQSWLVSFQQCHVKFSAQRKPMSFVQFWSFKPQKWKHESKWTVYGENNNLGKKPTKPP